MKKIILIFFFLLKINYSYSSELLIYLESAYNNNPLLNSQRESYKATKQNVNISISKFLPDVSRFQDLRVLNKIEIKRINPEINFLTVTAILTQSRFL